VSALYVTNTNTFGAQGGFDSFLLRIFGASSNDLLASLDQVYRFLLVMKVCHKVTRIRFTSRYYPLLQTAVFSRLEGLTVADLEQLHQNTLKDKASKEDAGDVIAKILSEVDALVNGGIQTDGTTGSTL
jgi:hypothetical protein